MAEAEVAPKPRTAAQPPPSGLQGHPTDHLSPKPRTAAKPPPSGLQGHPADHLSNVVARTTDTSVELLKSLETGELAAIDAVGKFVISIEDGLTEQVNSTSAVAKKLVIAIPDALTEQVTSTSAAAKKLVIAIEDAVTDEITGTATVAKKITVSGFEMADRFVRLEHDALRGLIQGAARPLVVQNGTKRRATQ
jgi:hypothetical protein